ncbi:MAG TPA: carbohydrate porin [Bryobacteraceae bacterium]|nr:carbohydrate porin [Bryobacteraceae bacterium]
MLALIGLLFPWLSPAFAQNADCAPPAGAPAQPPASETWNLYYQATSIGMTHGSFPALYSGPRSLLNSPEAEVSLTSTVFLGFRWRGIEFYGNPELAGGRGFSDVNGLANSVNGELPRIDTATPKPYVARAYAAYSIGFGDETESVESGPNQLAGLIPKTRYTVSFGRFSITDFFDDNRFSHDPRTQFMGWAAMYNGAWDYPADTRGYTWGLVQEFYTPNWRFSAAGALMPRTANGPRFDRRIFVNQGTVYEIDHYHQIRGHKGAVRVLAYQNRAHAGNYAEAIKLGAATGAAPDVTATRKNGTLKYGAGVSWDQEISSDLGVFGRLGWNDGKTESFAFTAMDRLASAGISVAGSRWRRKNDVAASLITFGGVSGVHAVYLSKGGLDFLIGDGALNYGPETVWESYYSFQASKWFWIGPDVQRIVNPGYNRDRGPLWAESLRLHLELNRDMFVKRP